MSDDHAFVPARPADHEVIELIGETEIGEAMLFVVAYRYREEMQSFNSAIIDDNNELPYRCKLDQPFPRVTKPRARPAARE